MKKNKFPLGIVAVLLAAVLMGTLLGRHLIVNVTDSDPHRLFWVSRETRPLKRWMYVAFTSDHSLHVGGAMAFIKKAGCVAGQILERKGREFRCDGELIAVAKERRLDGTPLVPFQWVGGTVPKGSFFAVGHRFRIDERGGKLDDSFDSRYFGLVAEEKIDGYLKPLL